MTATITATIPTDSLDTRPMRDWFARRPLVSRPRGSLEDVPNPFDAAAFSVPSHVERLRALGFRWEPTTAREVPKMTFSERCRFARNVAPARYVVGGRRCQEWGASPRMTVQRRGRSPDPRKRGYGSFRLDNGEQHPSHRLAWRQKYGAIPQGLVLEHVCDTRCCVKAEHLELTTARVAAWRGHGFHWSRDAIPAARRVMALPAQIVDGRAVLSQAAVARAVGWAQGCQDALASGEFQRVGAGVARDSVVKALIRWGLEDAGIITLAVLADER